MIVNGRTYDPKMPLPNRKNGSYQVEVILR